VIGQTGDHQHHWIIPLAGIVLSLARSNVTLHFFWALLIGACACDQDPLLHDVCLVGRVKADINVLPSHHVV
jgi:hypothetical protein